MTGPAGAVADGGDQSGAGPAGLNDTHDSLERPAGQVRGAASTEPATELLMTIDGGPARVRPLESTSWVDDQHRHGVSGATHPFAVPARWPGLGPIASTSMPVPRRRFAPGCSNEWPRCKLKPGPTLPAFTRTALQQPTLERARFQIASRFAALPDELVFTSSATERCILRFMGSQDARPQGGC